ncbi:MAG: succinate dehydrogenase cytochrome b subunit [Elusimicrobia bacterium]|nr:succinate dehydrogenase cytochrome b subunit [Elusimicrobiota bacterium]
MNIKYLLRFITTSIGRKMLMALTGLMLIGFIFFHLVMNVLLFKGSGVYNGAVGLITTPVTPIMEMGLFAIFIWHIFMGTWVRIEDWLNRPTGIERNWHGGRTIGSATMLYTAIILLAFFAYHVMVFRFGDHSRGMYEMVSSAFKNSFYVAIYIAGAIALVLHLSHGFQSAFQTLGINHPKYTPFIKTAGWLTAAIMILFALLPVYFLLGFDIAKL